MLHSAPIITFIFFQQIKFFGTEVGKFTWKFAIILIGLVTLVLTLQSDWHTKMM